MKLTAQFKTGIETYGFNCDTCRKTIDGDNFPTDWYKDDTEMLCPDCLQTIYKETKSELNEFKLTIKNIQDLIKINLGE